jgi:Regulator of chromosome condensation (RCC1) repeat
VVTVPRLHGVTAISTSDFYTCAVLSRGDVRCWGQNQFGQLGDGTTETRFEPISVRGLARPASGKASLDVFAGRWGGHERLLRITPTGHATMIVYVSCCIHVINLSFRLSHVRGTYTSASAQVQVTQVHVFAKSLFPHGSAPHVGELGTLRLNNGVITEPFLGEIYCDDARGQTGYCGA